MTSTDDIVCGKLNKEAMIENYAIKALNEESHSKALDNKRSSRGNQLIPSILGEVNTIIGATKKWATSSNKRRAHLRSVMAINAPTKRSRCHEDWQINFSPYEENIIDNDCNDPIVINNFGVNRILVDDGSVMEAHL